MAIGSDPAGKRHSAKDLRKASSPAKVSKSKAGKPSGVDALGVLAPIGTTDGLGNGGDAAVAADVEARLQDLQQKLDELLLALKK